MELRVRNAFLLAFCVITTSLSAQITARDGYIISNNNDTVKGRIEYSNSGIHNRCVFSKDNSSRVEWFRPGGIREFYIFPDRHYISVDLSGRKVFLKVLLKGKINLYDDESWLYISTDKDSIARLSGGKYIATIKGQKYFQEDNSYKTLIWKYTSDPKYYSSIKELSFDDKKITELIKEIDGNENNAIVSGQPGKTTHRFRFGVEAGISNNKFRIINIPVGNNPYFIVGLKPNEDYIENSYFAGINCTLKPGSGNFYFSGSADFNRTREENRQEYRLVLSKTMIYDPVTNKSSYDTLGTATDKYSFNLTSVSVPLVFHQEVSYCRIRPFFEAGLSARYIFNTDSQFTREFNINGSPFQNEYYLYIPKLIFSLRAGAGIRFIINFDYSLYAGVSIESSSFSPPGPGIGRYANKSAYLSFSF